MENDGCPFYCGLQRVTPLIDSCAETSPASNRVDTLPPYAFVCPEGNDDDGDDDGKDQDQVSLSRCCR